MPKLLPQVSHNELTQSTSYSDFPEPSHPPMVIYTHQPQTSIYVTTSNPSNLPLILQPEVAYYIEDTVIANPQLGEQYIITSDIPHFEHHPSDEQHEGFGINMDTRNIVHLPREFIYHPSQGGEVLTTPRSFVYAVTKDTDLNNLPVNIREAIEAQGKEVFNDKSILYVK